MADDSGIDPRHPAQFQRGFDPAVHPPMPPAPPARDPVGPTRLPGGPVTVVERVADPPPIAREAAPSPAPSRREDAGETHDPEPVAEPVRGIRGDLILLAGGAVLIVVALGFWWNAATDTRGYFGGPLDETTLLLQQLRYVLPQPLFVSGSIAIVAAIVVQALRRDP